MRFWGKKELEVELNKYNFHHIKDALYMKDDRVNR